MILVHPLIDPVIFSIGIFDIRWYSLAYVLGFILGIIIIKKINKNFKKPIENKIIDDFFVWAVVGVILGGRIGYILFYKTNIIYINPIEILYIWQGGMSFHGGLIGIICSIYFYSKLKKIDFFKLSDLVCIVAPIGIFLGRVANFINMELYGRVTDLNFAMIFPYIDNLPRHPSQLYEALFEGLILLSIMIYINLREVNKNKFGINTSFFLIFYGFFRFFLEFLREPDSHMGLLLNYFTMGQFLCAPMIIFGLIIYVGLKKNDKK